MSAPRHPHPRWPGIVAGILSALVFLFVVSFPFLFVWAWSGAHCEPKPDCQRFAERAVLVELAVIAGLAVLTGACVRALVDWAVRRRRAGSDGQPERVPRWAIACLGLLGLLMLWTGTSLFGF
jgi:hypothetical protein